MIGRGLDRLAALVDLGGPVAALLLAISVVMLATVLYKIVEYQRQGVGRHRVSRRALAAWRGGHAREALALLAGRRTHMARLLHAAMAARQAGQPPHVLRERLAVRAEAGFGRLEGGFRLLDAIAQVAPLLGLFGTVLGMIEAFRALQEAGTEVDPAVLAGGIWVALTTTAVGLAVAMPASLMLTWFEIAGRARASLCRRRRRGGPGARRPRRRRAVGCGLGAQGERAAGWR